MLANIPNQWHNYLFHEGEIGLLHNDLPISVIFICGNISACHFLVIPRSEPTTGILIFKTILFTGIPAFKIMVFWRCGILMRCSWPFLVMKIKSSTPLVSYSPLSELLEASVKWSGCISTPLAFSFAFVGRCSNRKTEQPSQSLHLQSNIPVLAIVLTRLTSKNGVECKNL